MGNEETKLKLGKVIRIYLADATVSGIRHAEIVNWTGQALACPRSKLQELREWGDIRKPGVYFLFGFDEESGQEVVYIGEAEVVVDRLASHFVGKDYWSEVIAFTSKDDNLTKGHVRYLESRLISIANYVGRYAVKNGTEPQTPSLPRPDRDAMEEYLEGARILLGVLGHKVLEPLVGVVTKAATQDQPLARPSGSTLRENAAIVSHPPLVLTGFKLAVSGLIAYATPTDEGLVVMERSEAAPVAQSSLSGGYRALREKLIQTGVLTPDGSKLRFTRNQLFSSPSQAAAIVVGYSVNGRDVWRTHDGKTYGDIEKLAAQISLVDILPTSS